ncbi:chromosomal replication initiator protein DnaA [Synergistes jonesii]|uniref:Chromosomal replication initiator protein DnaA n=1 Tax=Synergistes jonesii TaxID=2754 RepID=A0A073IUW5_9BACT|nr:chromosomal replication initiator protein DnaA [Synergistes jonesii]KEJ93271.1 chromosomal replication initiator protein DnaA [Synergistes jonesii]OFB63306.1 chromosomal replication initiator protein DnaA [Synergistes jonesii]OFB64858.1 chromosomal replication initiator protein DnaA [Synergistes jonesii]OFB66258.1 chromosomal replication initiator protein DnaA [Synergistes jonesii]OFB69025.1 chromosomal replication initiator protein DnaA [Synergistes jonesii]
MDLDIIWKEFYKYCVDKIGSEDKSIEIYLQTCMPVSLEEGVLALDVPTPFGEDQIRARYLDKMKRLFAETGFGSDIKLVVSSENQNLQPHRERVETPRRADEGASKNGLNPNYVFSTFVVGKSNRLPHAASLAVAESPGNTYNPFFIWGKVGLGKTHLMHAIGHHIAVANPITKMLYVSAEKFTNDLISAIRNGSSDGFRTRYRDLDVLMVDDVQFIAGKEQTQEEFFNTFNTLHNAKKQIIISADKPPKDIEGIADRLVSRFEWGLVTDIQPPDLETRVAILQKKAELKNYMNIPEDVIMFIAQNIPSNIRELEGSLNRIVACSDLNHEPINIENASIWLKDLIKEHPTGAVTIGLIQQLTAEAFGFSVEELLSKKRTADLALARQAAMYVARMKTNEPLIQIAYAFNKKDHTVVIYACNKIAELIKTDLRIRSFVDNIVNKL